MNTPLSLTNAEMIVKLQHELAETILNIEPTVNRLLVAATKTINDQILILDGRIRKIESQLPLLQPAPHPSDAGQDDDDDNDPLQLVRARTIRLNTRINQLDRQVALLLQAQHQTAQKPAESLPEPDPLEPLPGPPPAPDTSDRRNTDT